LMDRSSCATFANLVKRRREPACKRGKGGA
jgi:hypothetical protein